MTATLTLSYEDGTTHTIELQKAIEVDTPGLRELSFRETRKGWVMTFTKSLLRGKLADKFLTVCKGNSK